MSDAPEVTLAERAHCPNCQAPGKERAEIPAMIPPGVDFECGAIWDDGRSGFKAQPTKGCIQRLKEKAS